MKRSALILVAIAAAFGLVAAPTVPGATAVSGVEAAGKLRLIISEKGHILPYPPAGKFVLGGTAGSDSGTTSVAPREGRAGSRDGQSFNTVAGTDALYGKKGDLVIRFSGISIDVGTDASVEYGTWSIYTALTTGMYKGWRGGGRWASTGNDRRYTVRWEGLITP